MPTKKIKNNLPEQTIGTPALSSETQSQTPQVSQSQPTQVVQSAATVQPAEAAVQSDGAILDKLLSAYKDKVEQEKIANNTKKAEDLVNENKALNEKVAILVNQVNESQQNQSIDNLVSELKIQNTKLFKKLFKSEFAFNKDNSLTAKSVSAITRELEDYPEFFIKYDNQSKNDKEKEISLSDKNALNATTNVANKLLTTAQKSNSSASNNNEFMSLKDIQSKPTKWFFNEANRKLATESYIHHVN